jgi:hypothetical protein
LSVVTAQISGHAGLKLTFTKAKAKAKAKAKSANREIGVPRKGVPGKG